MVTAIDSEDKLGSEKLAQEKLSKVQWRCRRGMLELDVMLQDFCAQMFLKLSNSKQKLFEDLLEAADQDLQRWLVGGEPCSNPQWQDMILVIRHMYAMRQSQPA